MIIMMSINNRVLIVMMFVIIIALGIFLNIIIIKKYYKVPLITLK